MTIQLPLDTQLPPRWRIMRKKTWGSNWEELPTDRRLGSSLIPRGGYFHVEEFWRSCIPEPGQAILRFDFGMIDGQYVGINEDTDLAEGRENQDLINLIGQIIRIQCAPETGNPADTQLAWRTVWLGGVEAQRDNFAPGAGYVAGSRHFHCLDLLSFYTKRWDMNRHGVFVTADSAMNADGTYVLNSYGHPGYNSSGWSGRVIGNKSIKKYYDAPIGQTTKLPWGVGDNAESFGDPAVQAAFYSKLICHTHPGNELTTPWTDVEAVEHALAVTRPRGAPFFYLKNTLLNNLSVLQFSNDWPIRPGTKVWDFLAQVFRRQRARGVAYLDWASDIGQAEADSADLVPYIMVSPQFKGDISYTSPSGNAATFYGATTNQSTTTVDLVGDHRNIASTFELGDRYQHKYDWVESVGENIQVLATLDFRYGERSQYNSLQERWSSTAAATFTSDHSSDSTKCQNAAKYGHVYQLVGLNLGFNGTVGNGEANSNYTRVDYRCSDTGAVVMPDSNYFGVSPVLCKVMDDLPIYRGYDYTTSTPTPFDITPSDLSPARESIKLFVRQSAGKFIDAGDKDATYSCQIRNTPNGIDFSKSTDLSDGTRQFSGDAALGGNTTIKWTNLVATVGLELPHRVRLGTAAEGFTEETANRKLTIYHAGLHLWLADVGAIWQLSGAASNGFTPSRAAAGGTGPANPGILRDDRDRLAALHKLACSWYLEERRTATWQLKACGFLTSFTNRADLAESATTEINYPKMGQLVTTLSAGGTDYTLNTPITKIHFTNAGNGVTTWITDHCDLDFR